MYLDKQMTGHHNWIDIWEHEKMAKYDFLSLKLQIACFMFILLLLYVWAAIKPQNWILGRNTFLHAQLNNSIIHNIHVTR